MSTSPDSSADLSKELANRFRIDLTASEIIELPGLVEAANPPECEDPQPHVVTLPAKGMEKAGKPALPGPPPTPETSADDVKAALLDDIMKLIKADLAKANFTCSDACKVATNDCIVKLDPNPASLLVPSTGFVWDKANKKFKDINVCSLPPGKKVTARCLCVPLI
jgi:hypothetical protein